MPPNFLPRLVLLGGVLCVFTFSVLLSGGGGGKATDLVASHLSKLGSHLSSGENAGCAGWDPHGDVDQDPPNCLRARQLRQLQTVLVEGEPMFNAQAWSLLYHAERCVMGVIECPERPIILTDYWYFYSFENSNSGEGIWGDPIIATLKDLNFAPIAVNYHLTRGSSWNITRKLSELIHAYYSDEEAVIQCLADPRCVRPEDYVPAEDPEHRFDLTKIPEHEIGVMPAWRVFATSFWGARPAHHHGNGGMSSAWYGRSGTPEQPFSYHILGNKWHITPYAYPGHTHIPISIERSCLSAPPPPKERDDAIMILAKRAVYFDGVGDGKLKPEVWPEVIEAMKENGQTFWTVAKEEDGLTVPDGIVKYEHMTKPVYGKMVSAAKAMLAIGKPMISPSPYTALCRGVPVLIPYWGRKPTGPDDWQTYGPHWSQHGPAIAIGEPYTYAYNLTDPQDMIRQLKKAVSTPIKSYIPPEMTLMAVRQKVKEVVFHDWEGEYRAILEREGRVPGYHPIVLKYLAERRKKDHFAWQMP